MTNSPDVFVCALGCLVVLAGLPLCVAADEGSESRSGLIHELQAALADLAAEGRTYLGRLAGEQTVLSVQKVRDVLTQMVDCGSRDKVRYFRLSKSRVSLDLFFFFLNQ